MESEAPFTFTITFTLAFTFTFTFIVLTFMMLANLIDEISLISYISSTDPHPHAGFKLEL